MPKSPGTLQAQMPPIFDDHDGGRIPVDCSYTYEHSGTRHGWGIR